MIDLELVQTRLEALQHYADKLRPLQVLEPEALLDPDQYVEYWAIQRGLEMATQCVLDISSHIVVGLRLGRPREYREAILLLGQGGILPKESSEQLSSMASFRNIMVHGYLEIDPLLVHHAMTMGLDDLETFSDHVVTYLHQAG